jgi:hypothetical protein
MTTTIDINKLNQYLGQLQTTANAAAAQSRKAIDAAASVQKAHEDLKSQLLGSGGGGGRPDIQRIENIPGRRIPYDLTVAIPIAANSTSPQDVPVTISQDGPFVAVRRYATFLSAFQFQVTIQSAVNTFNGRSFGRYRPVSSVLDLFDSSGGHTQPVGAASPGTGLFALVSANQKSPFRTMEFDGTISYESGSGYHRQSGPVPSSLWAPGFEFAQEMPVLDFFERGDVITFRATPNHTNNPAAGNIQTLVGQLPYLDSQYDTTEGIVYGSAIASGSDIVTRQPDGILIVGFSGFKILAAASMP